MLAVAPLPHRVVVFDPLSGFQGRDDPLLFGGAVDGDDEGDVTPHGLIGGEAEQPLGGGVPASDDAVQRLADDGILRRLDDGRQQAIGEPENHAPIGSAVIHGVDTLRGGASPTWPYRDEKSLPTTSPLTQLAILQAAVAMPTSNGHSS